MKYNCLVVGQGIAGSVLSFLLEQRGQKVLVIDDGHVSSCSTIAAGLWNPVSFKNLHLTWRFDEFFDFAAPFYRSMESAFNVKLFFPSVLKRIFPDVNSMNEWDTRSLNPELRRHLGNDTDQEVIQHCNQPFGHGVVRNAGWLDVQLMLECIQQSLISRNAFLKEKFIYSDLIVGEEQCEYRGRIFDAVVFATGFMNTSNPWFNNIPVIPNKGQILTVRIEGSPFSGILNYGNFLLTTGDGLYKLGATYEREYDTEGPTADAQSEFLNNLSELYRGDVELISHDAALRPTTPDRKPIIGRHPEHRNLYIFNGLGSKGVIMAPWHASKLAGMMLHDEAIVREIDVARYQKP